MAGFVKLDTGVLNSSIWIERDLRSVFITSLVMAEPFELRESEPQLEVRSLEPTGWVVPPGWYGFVPAAGTGIIRRDGIEDVEAGLSLLEKLCAPDPDSRSQNYEGRRMARINHGYLILNFFEFRDRDYTAKERMRRLRARRKKEAKAARGVTRNGADVTTNVTQSEGTVQSTDSKATTTPKTKALVAQDATSENGKALILNPRSADAVRNRLTQVLTDVGNGSQMRLKAHEKRKLAAGLIFAYWSAKLVHPNTLLDAKRERTLVKRLEENGDNADELLYVVDGALRDDHLMGRKADSTRKYDGIETLFRDRAMVERLAGNVPGYSQKKPHPMAVKFAAAITGATGG